MSVKSSIRLGDELLVKSPFAYSRLVARQQQNGMALRIEGKGYAPYAIGGIKSQFFHICVARFVQRVNAGPSSSGPNCCNKRECARISFRTSGCRSLNSAVNSSSISTTQLTTTSMHHNAYVVKCI